MVTINIATLKEGTHDVVLEPDAGDLDLDPDRFEAIRVAAHLNLFNARIVVELKVSSLATLECDRTLQLFQQELKGKYTLLFAPMDEIESEDEEGLDRKTHV